jgi:hypothetical protein
MSIVEINLELPQKIWKKFLWKEKVQFSEFIEIYENNFFEYEKVWMKAKDFKEYLIKELNNG